MLELNQAKYLAGYRIQVRFNTGEAGIVDLASSLWGPINLPPICGI